MRRDGLWGGTPWFGKKAVSGQNPPRMGCSRAILRRQTKNVRGKTNMVQAGRGRAGEPVARCCAKKAPQVVKQPGLAC